MLKALSLASCLLSCTSPLQAAVLYRIDDGSAELVRTAPAGFDGLLGNLFSVEPGGELITSIEVAWGTPFDAGHAPSATPIEVLLYDDPNNDGVLDDLVLLRTGIGEISSPDSNTFVSYAIPATPVSGNFFAAVMVRDLPGFASPIATDQSEFQGVTYTYLAPDINASSVAPGLSFPMTDGNAMVRATGVPEPHSQLLCMCAAAIGLLANRHKYRLIA